MGKKRKTAKTGDKKLYKGRELTVSTKKNCDDDNMYNEIDRYHNQKEEEYIRLDQQPDEQIDDDGYADKEAVLDLAGGVSSSEDDDEIDSDDESVQDVNIEDDDEDEAALSSDDEDDADKGEDHDTPSSTSASSEGSNSSRTGGKQTPPSVKGDELPNPFKK